MWSFLRNHPLPPSIVYFSCFLSLSLPPSPAFCISHLEHHEATFDLSTLTFFLVRSSLIPPLACAALLLLGMAHFYFYFYLPRNKRRAKVSPPLPFTVFRAHCRPLPKSLRYAVNVPAILDQHDCEVYPN